MVKPSKLGFELSSSFLHFLVCVCVCVCFWRPISKQSYLWPRPCGPHRGTAVSVAGLPPGRCRLGTARVGQVVYVGLAAPPDTADLPRLLPSSAAPAAHPPLAHRPAGTTQEKRGWVNRKLLYPSLQTASGSLMAESRQETLCFSSFRVTSLVKWTLFSSIYWTRNQWSNSTNLAEISDIFLRLQTLVTAVKINSQKATNENVSTKSTKIGNAEKGG